MNEWNAPDISIVNWLRWNPSVRHTVDQMTTILLAFDNIHYTYIIITIIIYRVPNYNIW